MNETAQLIVDYVTQFGPAVTAVASTVASLIIIFRRTKAMNNQQLSEMHTITNSVLATTNKAEQENVVLKKQLSQVIKDNQEIKTELAKLTAKVKDNGSK